METGDNLRDFKVYKSGELKRICLPCYNKGEKDKALFDTRQDFLLHQANVHEGMHPNNQSNNAFSIDGARFKLYEYLDIGAKEMLARILEESKVSIEYRRHGNALSRLKGIKTEPEMEIYLANEEGKVYFTSAPQFRKPIEHFIKG